MERDPFLEKIAMIAPIVLLVLLGFLSIYSVVGVPFGITFFGLAIALAVYDYKITHGSKFS